MNRFSLIGGFAIAMLWIAAVAADTPSEQPKEIPLDQIWGYYIPGTRDVRELEPKADAKLLDKKLTGQSPDEAARRMVDESTRRYDYLKILKALDQRPKEIQTAGPAFVVTGIGKVALANAASIFAGANERRTDFPSDSDLSLVFYSHSCGQYVRLHSVERWSNMITVKYQFVSHAQTDMTRHFALIPLGKLSDGTYHVKIEQLKSIDETGLTVKPIGDPQKIVSGSFSFVVKKE